MGKSYKKNRRLEFCFNIIIDNIGNIYVEPWNKVLESMFLEKIKIPEKFIKGSPYCG